MLLSHIIQHRPNYELTKYTPYLALMDELWGVIVDGNGVSLWMEIFFLRILAML